MSGDSEWMSLSHLVSTSQISEAPDRTPSRQLTEQQLVQEICSAPKALEAHHRFEQNAAALEEWQIIFAEESNARTETHGPAVALLRAGSVPRSSEAPVLNVVPIHFGSRP